MSYTVKEWQKAYKDGKFKSPDRDVQVDAGWFDWFCDDSELAAKTKRLAGLVTKVKGGGLVDIDAYRVTMSNEMPASDHPTYDCVWFSDGDERVMVSVDDKRQDKKWNAYRGSFETPEFSCGSVTQMAKWLNEPQAGDGLRTLEVGILLSADEIREIVAEDAGVGYEVTAGIPLVRPRQMFEGKRAALDWLHERTRKYDGKIYFARWAVRGDGGGLIMYKL